MSKIDIKKHKAATGQQGCVCGAGGIEPSFFHVIASPPSDPYPPLPTVGFSTLCWVFCWILSFSNL